MHWHRLTWANWARCVAVTLIIGSISSTSGAKTEAICQIDPPNSVEAGLTSLERRPGPVAYSEEIHHPALLTPRISRGEMELSPNGDLVRRQAWPKVEESRIGEDFVTVTRNGQSNLLPIPVEMKPWIETLRAILTGKNLPPQTSLEYKSEGNLWRFVQVIDGQTGAEISLVSCGDQLSHIELLQADQTRRILKFHSP